MNAKLSIRGKKAMQRVDGYYLYRVGSQIHPLSSLDWERGAGEGTTHGLARSILYVAESVLEPLITQSVFVLKTSHQPGITLLQAVRGLSNKIIQSNNMALRLEWADLSPVSSAFAAFEAVLGAELALSPLYVVTQKAGFDTTLLIENGAACFPLDVWTKAPDAIPDLKQATRCIAFELFTASAFHLHRANETVLGLYWDAVTDGDSRPKTRNMGDYLAKMANKKVGDAKVIAALKELKDLHRNPIIHPEQTIGNIDDAIALMNSVQGAMVHMLKEIPTIAQSPVPLAGGVAPPPPS